MYVDEELGLDLTSTVYALDSTTIALCLSVRVRESALPAPPRRRVEDAHAARPAGQHSEFYPHLGWQDCTTFMHLPICSCRTAGAIYVVDRGYVDFARLYVLHQAVGLLRHACQVEHRCSSASLFGADRIARAGIICPTRRISPGRLLHPSGLPRTSDGASASRTPSPARRWSSVTNNFSLPAATICALYEKFAGRWNSSSSGSSSIFGYVSSSAGTSENAVKTQIWIARLGLRPRRHRQEASRPGLPRSTHGLQIPSR